ncbi:MAG: hypothetical protein U0939_18415 [Pirellulales bacterium]
MNPAISCPKCGRTYQVGVEWQGRQVQCQQCGAAFVVNLPPVNPSPYAPPTVSPAWPAPATNAWSAGCENPSGGPTNRQMRLGAAAALPLMLLGWLAAMFGVKHPTTGAIALTALAPFVFCFSIAALIDPNLPRAAGKFGGHLSARYKLAAGAVALGAAVVGGLSLWWRMSR